MSKKSLIIHDLTDLDLKYLPLIADITTGDIDGCDDCDEYEDEDIFTAAWWFINALNTYVYEAEGEDDKKAIARFVAETEKLLDKLRDSLKD